MKHFILFILITISLGISAQELNCNVQINSEQIEGSNKAVFNTLQQSVNEFMNNRKFTELSFSTEERIDCNMTIIVSSMENTLFTCEMQVQSRRPVFNATYSSPLLNFRDKKFVFTYAEFDQLEYQHQIYTDNLSAMLAYYAYLIIGFDMDSYAPFGGTPYFRISESIVNTCQVASMGGTEQSGWKAFERGNNNRYSLINNILDEAFKNQRTYFYDYHRLALDAMTANVENARTKIATGLPIVRECNRNRPGAVLVSTFLDTKADELVQIFSESDEEEKATIYELLMDLDPTRNEVYTPLAE